MSFAPGLGRLASALTRWRPSVATRIAISAIFLVSATLQIFGVPFTSSFGTRTRFDMDVYRIGGQIWHQGLSLYADGSMPFTQDGIWLPFTYPPFAALLFTPLGEIPLPVASVGISVVTAALLVMVTRACLTVLDVGSTDNRTAIAVVISTASIWFNPFWMTLGFGQINMVLMAMIVADVFLLNRLRHTRYQGVLIGIAAAVKLTPLVFLGVFLLGRRLRAFATGIAAFAVAALLGWIWMPADSVTYWTDTLFHTGRIGEPEGRINQNLNAAWLRVFGDTGSAATVMWIASSLVAAGVAVAAVRAADPVRALRPGSTAGRVPAMIVTLSIAIWGLLVSPTTWAHHWVWCVPAVLTCLVLGYRGGTTGHRIVYYTLAAAGTGIFAVGPFQLLPPIQHGWEPWQHVVGNAYTLWGLGLLVAFWLLPCHRTVAAASDAVRPPASRPDRTDSTERP
ncbi:glycosyltransferase 87 family protein [Gordonia shandongensis]|uniref:glycosyltransferase 87 family protein n=1 Tax=Gordonia shandongensis TaxID=376351 RepID=UPI0003F90CB6|nr:glycosyltransferase 87 family protein [Gordonia shandongensis]